MKPLPDADITTRIRARNYELVFFRNAVQTPLLQPGTGSIRAAPGS